MPNRLANETSPYLLQHKNNPVDWYPWGEEALERAVEINRPILLSIGYSSCHWCHVMERESFENPEIANLMNRNFICIKVDREERPDLDQIYQNVAQALTGGGGWPLTVFLTPARKPFFGGTYFPPEDRFGRPGFKRVLVSLAKAYATDPIGVAQNAMKLSAYVAAAETASSEKKEPQKSEEEILGGSVERLLKMIDWENGGIGSAPKFPNVMAFSLLWRVGMHRSIPEAKRAVLQALRGMASGGIYDHLGGGFSRYSVDERWSVPHFEKMLYDNGLLLKLYSEVLLSRDPAISSSDRELFVSAIRGTVRYLLREMVSPEGGFFAAQDADSEGEEGKFFVWNPQEAAEVLKNEAERGAFLLRYGVGEEGNFEHGKTVLFLASSIQEISRKMGVSEENAVQLVQSATQKVFEARSKRIPPATDTKILASWNGLAISGLCWASKALNDEGLSGDAEAALKAATRAFKLVSEKMTSGQDAKLFATFQGGTPRFNGYLDDYAFMAMAGIDLARSTSDDLAGAKALKMGTLWLKRILRHFKDASGGGYFFTSDDHEELMHRPKSIFDQAIPSGNAVTLESLLALAEIDSGEADEFSSEAESQLKALVGLADENPFGCAELLSAVLLASVDPLVVSGPGSESVCSDFSVFRGAQGSRDLLLCHQRSCSLPFKSLELLKEAARNKLGYPAAPEN